MPDDFPSTLASTVNFNCVWFTPSSAFTNPIRNTDNLTVGDFLVASSDTNVRYSQAFSEQMLESMDILSQAQQQLIYSVIVDERTFEEIGAEIGVDADQLRQDYKNILARLQEDLMWKFG